MAALRNALLDLARDAAEPLPDIREIFAEGRIKATAAVLIPTTISASAPATSPEGEQRAIEGLIAVGTLSRIASDNARHPASLHLEIEQGSVGLPTQPRRESAFASGELAPAKKGEQSLRLAVRGANHEPKRP